MKTRVSPKRGNRQRKQSDRGRRRATVIPATTAIVRVPPLPEKPWDVQGEQLTILKNAVCKGASDMELQYCLTVAKRYKLDPFKKQIWFVPRWDASADNGKGGRGTNVWIPTVGIDGLTFMAARDHREEYGSIGEPEFGPMQQVGSIKAPDWARVKVFKKGVAEPTTAIAYWDEYSPDTEKKNQYGSYIAPFWRRMPRRMISKCATALAIRQAYPDLGGVYIPEELEKMGDDHTESGRQIVAGVPTGGSHEAAQAVAQRKIAEASTKPIEAEIVQEEAPVTQPDPSWPTITIDWTHEASPIVTGDAELFKPLFDAYCKWGADGFWHTEPRHAERIRQASWAMKFKLDEIMPKGSPVKSSNDKPGVAGAQSKADNRPAQAKAPAKSQRKETNVPPPAAGVAPKTTQSSSVEPQVVRGTIDQANPQSGRSPRLDVLLKMEGANIGVWMSAFDTALFPHLSAGKGMKAELWVKKNVKGDKTYTNIVGLKRIGAKDFDEDMKTPILRTDREPGGKTLF